MDRDTVALLLEPIVQSAESRRTAARWIRSLPSLLGAPSCEGLELLLVWGDDDRFYPLSEAEFLLETASQGQLSPIEGGRYFHLVERPWELADAVGAFLETHSL
jgi:pimeloyl-ACP methyl ester carboxylesterase